MDGARIATLLGLLSLFVILPLGLVTMSAQVDSISGVTGGLLLFVQRGPILFLVIGGLALAGAAVAGFAWVASKF